MLSPLSSANPQAGAQLEKDKTCLACLVLDLADL